MKRLRGMPVGTWGHKHKVDLYREGYLIIVVVTQTSLHDGMGSIKWEGKSFDIPSRHAPALIHHFANAQFPTTKDSYAELTRLSTTGRVASSTRDRKSSMNRHEEVMCSLKANRFQNKQY